MPGTQEVCSHYCSKHITSLYYVVFCILWYISTMVYGNNNSYHFEHLLTFTHCHKLFSFIHSLKPSKNSWSWIFVTSTMHMSKKRLNNYPKITAYKWWSQRFIPRAHVLSRRQVCSCEQSALVRAVFRQRNSVPPISWGEVGDVEENELLALFTWLWERQRCNAAQGALELRL